jgi:Tol biopolymer transport system component
VFPLAQSVHYHAGTEWSPDGTSVLYVGYQGGVARIWKQGLREETPSPLDVVQAAEIFHFHLYPDGQWIFSIGRKSSDIVMFTKQYQSNR